MPYLNLQTIQKSESFIAANCMDENSKLYLQLMNGKIITMLHTVLTPIKQEYYSKFRLLFMRLFFLLKLDAYPGSISLLV